MILLEFAAQGVRGVAPAGGRATLRPGYNVVSADGAALRKLLDALLHPTPRDAEGLPRSAPQPGASPLRAGLTLVGDDRVTYRLVRDFNAACQLHRFDPEKRSFALVAQELPAIAEFLRKTAGVPSQARRTALLSVAAADLPSKQGGGAALPSAEAPQRATLTPDQAKRRVVQLRAELEKAQVAEKLQYQLDGLQAKLFKLEEALKGGQKIQEGLQKAETARAELSDVARTAEVLGDSEVKLAAYEKVAARRDDALAKATKEREVLDAADAAGGPLPFWLDPRFWGGAGGGLVLAAVAAWGASADSELRYLAVPAVAAYGVAGWFALRWVGEVEGWDRVARRRRVVDEWERKVVDQFERDGAEVHSAMKALGYTRASELKEAVGRLADADQVVAEWRRRVAEWEASPDAVEAREQRKALQGQVQELEAKLGGEAGGFVRDVRSVEAELQRVEVEASAAPAPAAAPAPPKAPPRPAVDPFRALLDAAGTELSSSPAAAARAVAQKASAHLSGLSFQRLQGIQPDDRGNLGVVTGGRPVPLATLPPADKDLVFLALKLAFVERALADGKTVAVADDAFAGLSDGAKRFTARLLKQIAKPGQVVHATSDAAFREAADHVS